MTRADHSTSLNRLNAIAKYAVVLLCVKVFVSILLEYRFYFPADFDAAFLVGRRSTFRGLYRIAFYAHIISSPLALVFATLLMVTGGSRKYSRLHRWLGRLNAIVVVAIVTPSGLVMATQALTGPMAGAGFACLAVATGLCMCVAVWNAWRRRFQLHRRWATRCFILLLSPLLLRLFSGVVIVMGVESEYYYRLNAWGSWIVPIVAYEIWCCNTHLRSSAERL